MFDVQVSIVNEWINGQCANALFIEHCSLSIVVPKGGA